MAIDYESVDQGTPIEGISIPALTRVALARFAGAVDDYNPMHLDDKVAIAAGKGSVFAPTNLVMGYLGRMVQAWAKGVSIRRFNIRLVRPLWPGDVLTCRGVIVAKRTEGSEHLVDMDVWADNQQGQNVAKGVVLAVVQATPARALSKTQLENGFFYAEPDPNAAKAGKKKPKKK